MQILFPISSTPSIEVDTALTGLLDPNSNQTLTQSAFSPAPPGYLPRINASNPQTLIQLTVRGVGGAVNVTRITLTTQKHIIPKSVSDPSSVAAVVTATAIAWNGSAWVDNSLGGIVDLPQQFSGNKGWMPLRLRLTTFFPDASVDLVVAK